MAISDQIVATAQQYGVDPSLALEVAQQESGLNRNAVSSAGAIGVFQLEPATAAMLGVNPYDVNQNIQGGIQYLAQMLAQFGGDVEAALAAYNWGPGNVSNAMAAAGSGWLSTAPAETQNYVQKILTALGEWNAAPASLLPPVPASPIAMPSAATLWDSLGPTGQMAVYVGLGVVSAAIAAAAIF